MPDDTPAGRPLDRALDAGPLTPAAGVALADDLFGALEALHRSGQAHGYVREHLVRVLPDGSARLMPSSAPGGDRAADVRAAAELVCSAVGIRVLWSPAEPLRDGERAAPALAATLRALAQGSLPLDASSARSAVDEAAGGLGADEARAGARAELAARSGAARPPAAAPRTAAAEHHPGAVLMAPLVAPGRRPLQVAAGVAAGVILLGGLGLIGWITAGRHQPVSTVSAPSTPPPRTKATVSPSPLPSIPPAAGDVKSVAETPQNTCQPGATCKLEVDVHFVKAEAPEDITWQFELVDNCTSDATYVQGGTVRAQKGWVHVVGDSELALPAGHPLAIVAITTAPSHAASAPLLITTGNC